MMITSLSRGLYESAILWRYRRTLMSLCECQSQHLRGRSITRSRCVHTDNNISVQSASFSPPVCDEHNFFSFVNSRTIIILNRKRSDCTDRQRPNDTVTTGSTDQPRACLSSRHVSNCPRHVVLRQEKKQKENQRTTKVKSLQCHKTMMC
ncbi:hypothetical protein JOB18_024177 [Solea senegalensis]|uniref:Uncharacterized protein n=1 Tax=Solea senegalensis TaxID=28829 RepID=A0AAV6Q1F1_SOLSE|nr:hypothetical protein JOB18_024177 [Solea senegalensis]